MKIRFGIISVTEPKKLGVAVSLPDFCRRLNEEINTFSDADVPSPDNYFLRGAASMYKPLKLMRWPFSTLGMTGQKWNHTLRTHCDLTAGLCIHCFRKLLQRFLNCNRW